MSESMKCPITGCPMKNVAVATLLAFGTIFFFEMAFHGVYMMPAYEATSELWRTTAEMQALSEYSLAATFLRAVAFATIFCWLTQGQGRLTITQGLKFGALFGLVSAGCSIGSYAWMPLPLDIPLKWMGGELIMGMLTGAVVTLVINAFCSAKGDCA